LFFACFYFLISLVGHQPLAVSDVLTICKNKDFVSISQIFFLLISFVMKKKHLHQHFFIKRFVSSKKSIIFATL